MTEQTREQQVEQAIQEAQDNRFMSWMPDWMESAANTVAPYAGQVSAVPLFGPATSAAAGWYTSRRADEINKANQLRAQAGIPQQTEWGSPPSTGTEVQAESGDPGAEWERNNVGGAAPPGVTVGGEGTAEPKNPYLIPPYLMDTARTVLDENGNIAELYLPDGKGGEIAVQYKKEDAWNVLAPYRNNANALRRFREAAHLAGYMAEPATWTGPLNDSDLDAMEGLLLASNMSGLNWSDMLTDQASAAADAAEAEALVEDEQALAEAGITLQPGETPAQALDRAEDEAEQIERLKERADKAEAEAQRNNDAAGLEAARQQRLRIAQMEIDAGKLQSVVDEAEAGNADAQQLLADRKSKLEALKAEQKADRERRRQERQARLAEEARIKAEVGPWLDEFEQNNGVVLTDEYKKAAVFDLVKGRRTLEEIDDQMRSTQVAPQFPAFKEEILSGMNLRDLAQPYVQTMAQTLEIDPNTIGLNDPTIRKALKGVKGERLNVYDFEDQMRKDKRWQYTDNAWEEVSSEASSIAQMFGVM